MNKTIKIALISIVLIGIVSVIIFFIKGTGNHKIDTIANTPFEKEIEAQVKAEIEDKDYQTASTAFGNILKEIETEASIINANGTKQLTDNEVSNCNKIAFFAYLPIFDSYQESYFNRSSWTDSELSALKSRAQSLLSMNIAEEQAKSKLSKVITNVNDYHAAWAVVKSARSCATVAQVNSIKSKVVGYNHAPLTNNASLRAGLNSAYSDAKNSLSTNINAYCRKIAQSYKSYGSYERFYAAEDAALGRIREYVNAFGGGSFSEAKNLLNQADQNAMDYYDNDYE